MRNRSLWVKLLMFGLAVSILPVVFVGGFSYIQSSKQVQELVNRAEFQLIQQVSANIERILMTVDHTMTNLLESTVMAQAFHSPLLAGDFQLYNNLRKEIIHLQSFDTQVEEVILLNQRQNWLIRSFGIRRLDQHPDAATYLSLFDLPHDASWQLLRNSDFTESISGQRSLCPYTISLVRKLPNIRTEKYILAMANIPACSLAEIIYQGSESGEILVAGADGKIFIHRDPAMIGTKLSDHPVIQGSVFPEASGQFRVNARNGTYTVTYYQSAFNGWTYLSVVSMDELTSRSRRIGWMTFGVSLVIIALSILFVWLVSRRLYLPVSRLVQSIRVRQPADGSRPANEMQLIEQYIQQLFSSKSKLELELREHSRQIRFLFLSRLFNGSLRPSEIEEHLDRYGWLERVRAWKSMAVVALQVDRLDQTRYETKDTELLQFAVSNIVEETFPQENRLPPVWMDRTLVVLAGFTESDPHQVFGNLYQLTESLQQLIDRYLHLSVSVGISSLFRQLEQAPRAVEEGMEALKHRLILGKGVIVPFDGLHAGASRNLYDYPVRIEHELIDAIKFADREEALNQLACWMQEAIRKAGSPTDSQIAIMRLLNRLLILKQEAGIRFEQLGIFKTTLYKEVLDLHVSEEIEQWFRERLVLPLVRVFDERRNSQYHSLSERLIDLIQRHYDEELTLGDCANRLHYNASYLSSVFKKETGCTFSEYLGNYRLHVAKQWLTETDMTIREIAERLKYSNSHNFIRSFRKQEGMTPGQYQEKYARK